MPVVGYFIALNEQILALSDLDPRFRFVSNSHHWRLIFFFYGTCAMGLASIVFILRCPGESKKYDTAIEYTAAERHFWADHIGLLVVQIDRDLSRLNRHHKGYMRLDDLEDDLKSSSAGYALESSKANQLMNHHWEFLEGTDVLSRVMCRFLYDLAFAILAVPTIITVIGVSLYAFPELYSALRRWIAHLFAVFFATT